MNFIANSHCSYCGHAFPNPRASFPRMCDHCGSVTYMNPKPVVVILLPIKDEGILLVRRATSDGFGKLALPGGYLDLGESWQEGAARELREETGIQISPDDVHFFSVENTDDKSHILIFCQGPETSPAEIPPAPIDQEVSEYVVTKTAIPLAFPTHTEALKQVLDREK